MALAQVLFENGADFQALVVPRRDPETGNISSDHHSMAAKAHFLISGRDHDLMASRHYRDFVGGWGVSGDAADPSAVLQTWGQWDAAENLRIVVGGKLATGADGTEFGGFELP